tara:strand:+ start:190 stop:681 length:492 start_codon:yes stop_codon:yes gene_type:complete
MSKRHANSTEQLNNLLRDSKLTIKTFKRILNPWLNPTEQLNDAVTTTQIAGITKGYYPQPQGGELQGVHGGPDYGSFVDMALEFPDIKLPREFVEIVLFQLTCNPADCYNDDDCSVTHKVWEITEQEWQSNPDGGCTGVGKFISERGYRDEYTGGDITEFLGY